MKNLIIISAPSGAVKQHYAGLYRQKFLKLNGLIFYNKKKRKMEKNGIDYQFISESTFKNLIDNSFFAEWEKVHGFYYGTSKDSIDNIIKKNEMLLLEMDVKGALSIKSCILIKPFLFL